MDSLNQSADQTFRWFCFHEVILAWMAIACRLASARRKRPYPRLLYGQSQIQNFPEPGSPQSDLPGSEREFPLLHRPLTAILHADGLHRTGNRVVGVHGEKRHRRGFRITASGSQGPIGGL